MASITSKHSSVRGVGRGTSRGGDGGWQAVEFKPALKVMRIHRFSGFLTQTSDVAYLRHWLVELFPSPC